MMTRLGLFLVLAAALATIPAAAATKNSGNTYTRRVCPKPPGGQVMRCHALVVTDSKGKPIAAPVSPLPNGKRRDR